MMRVRLRLLLNGFNKSVAEYALARLEVALANPAAPSPPVISRLGPYVRIDDEFASKWPSALAQIGVAARYIAAGNRGELGIKRELEWTRLGRIVKTIGRFAESIEWIGPDGKRNPAGDRHP